MSERRTRGGWQMQLSYDHPVPAAIGLLLDDASHVLMRHGWWRRRPTPLWFLGHRIMRLGSAFVARGGQRVFIDRHELTKSELFRWDRGIVPWEDADPRSWLQRLIACLRAAVSRSTSASRQRRTHPFSAR